MVGSILFDLSALSGFQSSHPSLGHARQTTSPSAAQPICPQASWAVSARSRSPAPTQAGIYAMGSNRGISRARQALTSSKAQMARKMYGVSSSGGPYIAPASTIASWLRGGKMNGCLRDAFRVSHRWQEGCGFEVICDIHTGPTCCK